jgi:AcrR family transcriptional regulator
VTGSVKRVSRAEQARATRRRIVDAAAEQFVAHGYGATLLDQVAERAGVAVQTVYFHFGNKRTLLKEALDVAAVGDDDPVPLLERAVVREIQAETDPRRIIERWLEMGRVILDRVVPLMRVVRGATSTDAEVMAQWRTSLEQTRAAHGHLIGLLQARGALRPGLDAERARDIAFVVGGVETFMQYTDICGWSADEWQAHTAAVLADALLSSPEPL